MSVFLKLGRNAALLLLCITISACTQTTSSGLSTYGGKLGNSDSISGGVTKGERQKKVLAARKRAKAIEAKRKSAFLKKRLNNRKDRQAKRKARQNRRATRRKNRRTATLRKSSKKLHKKRRISKRKKSVKRHNKSRTRRVAKRRFKKIKKSTYAYVGGRSKGVSKHAPWRCVPGRLKKVISQISRKYGRVIINSTHRSRRHNRRVGGKRRSYHLRCRAIDFRVRGRTRGLTRWLAHHPSVGGYKRYRSGFYHIDSGPRRTW